MSQETALARCRWKQVCHRRQESVVAIGHDEVHLGRSARSQVFEQADSPVFALLCAGPERQHLFVASQVHSQRGQDHGRIDLVAVTHAEMDPIEVEDAPVLLQTTLAKGW
jgi:hypothetical protein